MLATRNDQPGGDCLDAQSITSDGTQEAVWYMRSKTHLEHSKMATPTLFCKYTNKAVQIYKSSGPPTLADALSRFETRRPLTAVPFTLALLPAPKAIPPTRDTRESFISPCTRPECAIQCRRASQMTDECSSNADLQRHFTRGRIPPTVASFWAAMRR
jgi:hypothetical protein